MTDKDAPEILDGARAKQPVPPDNRIRAARVGAVPPAAPIPPRFSQPVRQIALMLVVLALVVAGGWYAYGRVMSIFLANPVLNGVIMGVFVLGVLTCFWQVGQLVHSVSWIERFASLRRNAAVSRSEAPTWPDTQAAPRLLAPLAALLGAGGTARGAISTASSRSILDSVATRIDELRDITRYMSNLLIFLGLLGTFYGLAITVPAVVDTIRALSPQEGETGMQVFDKLMSGLEGQLGGMGTAFSSSLLGLAGSLVVGLLELFVTHGQNRFYRELEEWMSSFTRVDIGAGGVEGADPVATAGLLDRLAAQIGDLHDYYRIRDAERANDAAAAETRITAMTAGIETLAAQLLRLAQSRANEANDQTRSITEILQRIADAQVEANHQPPDQNAALPALLERLITMQDAQMTATRQIAAGGGLQQISDAMARISADQNRLVALHQQLADQTARPAISEQEESDLIEARMHLRSLDYQLARLVEEMAAGRADLIADLRADVAALTRALHQSAGQGRDA